jgi:uncharacterized protein
MNKYYPLPLKNVDIHGGFWGPRLEVNRSRTIPAIHRQLSDTGRIDAFRLDWQPGKQPTPHRFWDSDVAKWLEAASYSLQTHPDPVLDAQIDEVVALISAAQQPDGYLNTYYTAVEPELRWANLRDSHELYCAGHLIEAAVAHNLASGKRSLLDPILKYVDHIATTFGPGPNQKHGYCGHQEIELALVKLYRLTGENRYLQLSRYFIDERGRQPHYFDLEAVARGENPSAFRFTDYRYNQSHLPAREQREVVGHAVRAMYMYSAMADLATETGDASLLETLKALWQNLTSRRLYLTGGIGPSGNNEGFTSDFDLPNETAYAETCAAIGLVFWMQRMLQLDLDGRYADLLEQALYNGVLSGVSLDGERFFYENPLVSQGNHHRQEWYSCACCPPNLSRLLASLGEYIYAQSANEIVVHLYAQSAARLNIAGQTITLRQQTNYPWEGDVHFRLEMDTPAEFTLCLRIPGWSHNEVLESSISGGKIENGYLTIFKKWSPGDEIDIEFDMPVERIYAHPDVGADVGRVAIQRGPLVYCLEQVDHSHPVHRTFLPSTSRLHARFDTKILDGVTVIEGEALSAVLDNWQDVIYRTYPPEFDITQITAIPYFAWDNRSPGEMFVWLPEK